MTSSEMVKQVVYQSEMNDMNEPKQNSYQRRNRPGCSVKVQKSNFERKLNLK